MANGVCCSLHNWKNVASHPGMQVNYVYYCGLILSQMILDDCSVRRWLLFQQDLARLHTSAHTLRYLNENIPTPATLLQPEKWPQNSPDLNTMDYAICWDQGYFNAACEQMCAISPNLAGTRSHRLTEQSFLGSSVTGSCCSSTQNLPSFLDVKRRFFNCGDCSGHHLPLQNITFSYAYK